MSDTRRTKHGHTLTGRPGAFTITLDKRAASLGIGTENDPYLIAEMMALDAMRAEAVKEAALEQMSADEEPAVVAPPDATREERRTADLQNQATDQESLNRLTDNEGLPRAIFSGNAARARARRRIRERRATVVSSHENPNAFERAVSRIKSFGQTVADIMSGAIYDRRSQ
jgi:DNA-binding helix-hairpin-helix protein with protein kinase domain